MWRDSFLPEGPPVYFHPQTILLIVASGILNFLQNLVTFTLIHKLTALSYAVANAAKRIIVISVSIVREKCRGYFETLLILFKSTLLKIA